MSRIVMFAAVKSSIPGNPTVEADVYWNPAPSAGQRCLGCFDRLARSGGAA